MTGRRTYSSVVIPFLGLMACGCGTTKTTDTLRSASEMLLVSQAVDNAIGQIDCSALRGKPVYVDTKYLDATVDKGYLISSLRQHLLAHGAMVLDDRNEATYVVEVRSGGVGTDRHTLLIGTPQITVPSSSLLAPGIPTQIPEIGLVRKTEQKGIAKIAVFAYNRKTGEAVWQSGLVDAESTLKDLWVFGAGPFSRGTIRRRTELAGSQLPSLPLPFSGTYPSDKSDEQTKGETAPAIQPTGHTAPAGEKPAPQQPPPTSER